MAYRIAALLLLCHLSAPAAWGEGEGLTLSWRDNYLTIHGQDFPGGQLVIHYLEAYCRANSQTTDWVDHTVIGHKTELIAASEDRRELHLRCQLNDGLVVDHQIIAGNDEVSFQIVAHNPTQRRSEAHWAQPCIHVGRFTGAGPEQTDDAYAYVPKSFIFLDGQLTRLPTEIWATEARYTPGQVWAAPGVPRSDVNPRPLNPQTPNPGLIGCYRDDDQRILAVAFQPYQELFQGVIRCLHSDFRLGGIPAGQRHVVTGKLYVMDADIPALLARFRRDFGND